MNVQLELWHLILLLLSFFGAAGGGIKFLFDLFDAREVERHAVLEAQLSAIERVTREDAAQWQRVERELLALKADLPLNYVRRDDFVRVQSVIEAKLDGLALRIENFQLKRGNDHD